MKTATIEEYIHLHGHKLKLRTAGREVETSYIGFGLVGPETQLCLRPMESMTKNEAIEMFGLGKPEYEFKCRRHRLTNDIIVYWGESWENVDIVNYMGVEQNLKIGQVISRRRGRLEYAINDPSNESFVPYGVLAEDLIGVFNPEPAIKNITFQHNYGDFLKKMSEK